SAEMRGGEHEIGRQALRQHVQAHDPEGGGAGGGPRLHVGHLAHGDCHDRITRPPNGMRVMAMAMMTAGSPVPMATDMAMARIRSGKAWRISMTRWLARSKRPPR